MSDGTITIGADPEMAVCNERGHNISEALFDEMLDEDNKLTTESPLGLDGCGAIFELRPQFSLSPTKVVANVHSLFARQVQRTPSFARNIWRAGSFIRNYKETNAGDQIRYGNAMGGHIHLGGGNTKSKPDDYIDALEWHLGVIGLLIEDKHEAKYRRRHDDDRMGYGMSRDTRYTTYGIEYRVCSSWLSSPQVAAGLLCLAKTIAEDVNEKGRTSVFLEFPNREERTDTLTKAINKVDTVWLRAAFPEVWTRIITSKGYQIYKPQIDILYHLIQNHLTWFPTVSMQTAWGVGESRFQGSAIKDSTLSAIWSKVRGSQVVIPANSSIS